MEKEKVLKIIHTGVSFVPLVISGIFSTILVDLVSSKDLISFYEGVTILGLAFIILMLGLISTQLFMKNDR